MDQRLLHLINERWTSPALDLFMAAMSNIDIWKPLLAVAIVLLLLFGGFKGRACLFCLMIALLVAVQVTHILKLTIDRPRPKQVERVRMVQLQKARPEFMTLFKRPTVRYSDETDRNRSGPSFPSGHMTNNTVVAVCLTLFYRRRGALWWIIAVVVGYSRIYLGAHWPSDIVGSWFLAVGETLLIVAALESIWRWSAPKLAPNTSSRHPSLIFNASR